MFTSEIIQSTRRLTMFLRKNRGLNRSEIAKDAHIKATDLDNFTTMRTAADGTQTYKVNTPNKEFALRLIKYILDQERYFEGITNTSFFKSDYSMLKEFFEANLDLYEKDHLYEALLSEGLWKDTSLKNLSKCFTGNFMAYRFSHSKNKFHRSFFEIEGHSIYKNGVRFRNFFKNENDEIKKSSGIVFDSNGMYHMVGKVEDPSDPERTTGLKIVILGHAKNYTKSPNYNGIILSHDAMGSYEFGRVALYRYDGQYSSGLIGTINRDDLDPDKQNLDIMLESGDGSIADITSDPVRIDRALRLGRKYMST